MRLRAVAVLVLLSLPLVSQAPPPVSETLEVRLIEVDATVVDKDGNPVHGLTAGDFILLENGKPKTITNFAEYREITSSAAVPAAAPAAPQQVEATVERPAPRKIIVFLDVLPMAGPARVRFFDELRAMVSQTMRDGDSAQVMQWHDYAGVLETTKLTDDRKVIDEALAAAGDVARAERKGGVSALEYREFFDEMARAEGRATATDSTEWNVRAAAEDELALMRRKTAAMTRILSAMGQPDGRSLFVYASEGFPMVAGTRAQGRRTIDANPKWRAWYSTRKFLDSVVAAANANGVSIYGLRPVVPHTMPIGSLEEDQAVVEQTDTVTEAAADQYQLSIDLEALSLVAEQTGGTWGAGVEGVKEVMERVVRDAGSYYTLAYRATSDGSDRHRRIDVRAKNRELVVRTRRTVVEKSERTRRRDLVVARLFETGPANDLELEVKTGEFQPASGNRVLIPIELTFPAEQLTFEGDAASFTVLAVAGGNLENVGQVHEESQRVAGEAGKAAEGMLTYHMKILHDRRPGTLAIALIDDNSGMAGTRLIKLGAGDAIVEELPPDRTRDPEWAEAKARALREQKPLVVFFRPIKCTKCTDFERGGLTHPAIQRRLPNVVFITLPVLGSDPAKQWSSRRPGFAVFDHAGTLRAKWERLPQDATTVVAILDGAIAAAPHFEKAVALSEKGPHEGELELAVGLAKFGLMEDARAAVERAIANGSPETRQLGLVGRAMLDLNAGKGNEAIPALDTLIGQALTPDIAATAWMGIGFIHRTQGNLNEAIRAYAAAVEVASIDSDSGINARKVLDQLREIAAAQPAGPIRIVPPHEQLVTGRRRIRTIVESAAVAKVVFSVDGAMRATVERPPFSAVIDFGRMPQAQTVRTVAFDARGKELGRAQLTVNNAGEMFWLRLVEPREGPASGTLRVSTTMRAPAAHQIKRIVVTWNDEQRAVMTAPPWQAQVSVPNELGILRAVAELDDGRTAEDAVLLNASGYTDRSDVPLVELPVTIKGGPVKAEDITVREGSRKRIVESVTAGADAPLTVGMLIDTSASMQSTLADVQEAAIRFLDTALGPKDRAFLITFDAEARLVQIPTTDRAKLRDRILGLRASGSTALHDATILGLLQFEGVRGRRALVVFSDGADRNSRYHNSDVLEVAKRSNIPIYMIAAAPVLVKTTPHLMLPGAPMARPKYPTTSAPPVATNAQWTLLINELTRVTESTGGRLHKLFDFAELDNVYKQIEADLRAQSLVEIRTDPGKSENDWRKIEVDVAGRADVRAPAGYFAPW